MVKCCTHWLSGWLALAFVLGARCGHFLGVAIWNIQQDTGALLTAVRTGQVGQIYSSVQPKSSNYSIIIHYKNKCKSAGMTLLVYDLL